MIIVAQLQNDEGEEYNYKIHTATDKGLHQMHEGKPHFNDFWTSTKLKRSIDNQSDEYGFTLILE